MAEKERIGAETEWKFSPDDHGHPFLASYYTRSMRIGSFKKVLYTLLVRSGKGMNIPLTQSETETEE